MEIGCAVYQVRNYTLIEEERITVVQAGKAFSYQKSDVETFRIYANKHDLVGMELTFADGRKTEVFSDVVSNTDAWNELYYSDMNYAAALAGELIADGANAVIEDMSAIEVDGLEDEVKKGYEQILELRK